MKKSLRYLSLLILFCFCVHSNVYAQSSSIDTLNASLQISNSEINSVLSEFKKNTDVEPYISATTDLKGKSMKEYSMKLYDELFSDGNHLFILVYQEEDSTINYYLFPGYSIQYFISLSTAEGIITESMQEDCINTVMTILQKSEEYLNLDNNYHSIAEESNSSNYVDYSRKQYDSKSENAIENPLSSENNVTSSKNASDQKSTLAIPILVIIAIIIFLIAAFVIVTTILNCLQKIHEAEVNRDIISMILDPPEKESNIDSDTMQKDFMEMIEKNLENSQKEEKKKKRKRVK